MGRKGAPSGSYFFGFTPTNAITNVTVIRFHRNVFRIGEVILDTVRQKREYSSLYPAQLQGGGSSGESGRDRLRRMNQEPRRDEPRQETRAVPRNYMNQVPRDNRSQPSVPISSQRQFAGHQGNQGITSSSLSTRQLSNLGNKRGRHK